MDGSSNHDAGLSEYFELQLSEIELLNSMYPNASEFSITLPSVLADMKLYIGGKRNRLPLELDFTLNLDVPDRSAKFELNVALPHEYPMLKPHVTARSPGLNRHQQKELNDALYEYIKSLDDGELCVLSVITWLSENTQNYFSLQSCSNIPENASHIDDNCQDTLCRLWIYSHHIFSKFKRRDILDIAQDLKLTGFSLPGKPGFICVEGTKKDCSEFQQQLKKMSWKKLSLVKEETIESSESNLQTFRKFKDFQEISFQVRRGPAKEYHMDMGQFLKYLEAHNCAYAFHDLFGIEGHISNDK
ncbi:RWD domain-containing protein 2A [Araneus ventricosus]|uniref:RWD domain-containing protein 2A n=1 Tax=Araneus ventricosus TaxID=182803 RepID=A0A4Y2H6I6_ARAVE|nr:RWD domain-containing protein 2A [Araneus ventricosus]